MLVRTSDPLAAAAFRDIAEHIRGTSSRPAVMPMDAWIDGHEFVAELDLPGVKPEAIDIDVEQHTLTVKVERSIVEGGDRQFVAAERPRGVFSRQLVLGENLDMDRLEASYDAGVLRLRVPVSEQAKPRKVTVTATDSTSDRATIGA